MDRPIVGIVGGSGLYELEGIENAEWHRVKSSFGEPSDEILHCRIEGLDFRFLPRHGRGHRLPPSAINFRANIDALKRSGVTDLVSLSAAGSLREDLAPGTFVLVDQFIDRTFAREKSFFGPGLVAHVSMAHPVSARLVRLIAAAAADSGIETVEGGTYLAMEGPQFSSRAESDLYRSWKCDVIGMTNMPEAKLAREAEIAYASVAMITDYDCWHPGHDAVTVEQVIDVLLSNAARARGLVSALARKIAAEPWNGSDPAYTALDVAIITAPESRDPEMKRRLDAIAGRALG